jgi:hypothetical protein
MRLYIIYKHEKGRAVPYTHVMCDGCPDILEYRGNISRIMQSLRSKGWTLGTTGLVRCRPCTKSFHTLT